MRKTTLFIFLLAMCVVTTNAQTNISGDIKDIRFSSEDNPYVVQKDLIIPKGETVIIPEGIVFLFHPFSGIRVEGRLNVTGTEEQMVVFTSINDKKYNPASDVLPNPFDWNGIYVAKDADGAHMNHFSLMYSVYGVKSQCNSIIIQNAVFQKNGQFHFTVNEKIKPVVDNIPFSYKKPESAAYESKPPADKPSGENATAEKKPVASTDDPSEDDKSAKDNRVLRYASLGAGVAGGITATIFALKMNKHKSRMDEIDSSGENLQEWSPEHDKWIIARSATVISGIIGALGAVGFAVSFTF
ncbi:MAG: hypothetical protein ACLFVE_11505 [Chitinispirillaceae bacterium]